MNEASILSMYDVINKLDLVLQYGDTPTQKTPLIFTQNKLDIQSVNDVRDTNPVRIGGNAVVIEIHEIDL